MTSASASTSTPAQNLAVFERFLDLVNEGRFDELDPLVHVDYVGHIPFPSPAPGFAGEKMIYRANAGAVPDIRLYATRMLAEGDYVVGLGGVDGTHTGGDLFGVPARGTKLHWDAIDVARFHDGQIVERWLEADAATLFRQLGLMPGPTELPAAPLSPEVDGPDTSPEENKALMRRFIQEVWNEGRLEVADEIFHPLATSPSAPQLPTGGEGVKLIAQAFRTAFPDYWMRIDFLVAEGDLVCGRFTQGGTHRGELMGIPATNRTAEWTELGILRFQGGRVVESWYQANMLGLMAQLGLAPS